jgi:hypothetical protein
MGSNRRIHAAVFSFIAGVIPPIPMLGRSKVGLVRRVDIWTECSKGLLPTVSTSGGVAASYGSGYALKVMREHMERVW